LVGLEKNFGRFAFYAAKTSSVEKPLLFRCFRQQFYKTFVAAFNARVAHYRGRYSFGHNSPAAAAREVFKPSTDSASLPVPTQTFFPVWGQPWETSQVGVF